MSAGFTITCIILGYTAFALAKYHLDNVSMVCNPPIKFSTPDDQSSCFSKCEQNPSCFAAVHDSAPRINTCAFIDNGTQCGPTVRSARKHTTFANFNPPNYAVAPNMEIRHNVAVVGMIEDNERRADYVVTAGRHSHRIEYSEVNCGKLCALYTGCNGYVAQFSNLSQEFTFCLFKSFGSGLNVEKEAKCVERNETSEGVRSRIYFADAGAAPKAKCGSDSA